MLLLHQLGAAFLLVTITLWLQCGGIAVLITWVRRNVTGDIHKFGPFRSAVLIVRVTTAVITLHSSQVLVWAGCYRWLCLPSWESALYFSATSYSTVGYGDIVLPAQWRMLGPVESILGVLMCGLSVSLLFAIATRLVGSERPSAEQRVAQMRCTSAASSVCMASAAISNDRIRSRCS
jgi:voltage-gated potassium channel